MTLRAGHNQICVHQILGVSWNTRLRNTNIRHAYSIIRYLQELGCTFNKNVLPNKGKHLTKKSWRNCVFHVFFWRFSSQHIQGHQLLRQWGRAQRADISQTTFSYVLKFSLLKIVVFRFELHPFVLRIKLAIRIGYNWLRLWPGAEQVRSHYLSKWWYSPTTHRWVKKYSRYYDSPD